MTLLGDAGGVRDFLASGLSTEQAGPSASERPLWPITAPRPL